MHPFLASLLGGALIGLSASLLLLLNGRIAGISGIVGGLLPPAVPDRAWRVAFLAGLLVVGAGALVIAPSVFDPAPVRGRAPTVLAGLLVGFGTSLGNGCTSGHGICGLSRLSPRSLAAVLTFMATAALTVFVTNHLLGGLR